MKLTPLQAGMLFHSQLAPQSGVYVQQLVVTLPEQVDAAAMREAWQFVAIRYDALRSVFRNDGDTPFQTVLSEWAMPFEELDWNETLDDFLRSDRRRGFDLATLPPTRLTLIRRGPVDSVLVWTFHHALLDGRSHRRVLEEAFDTYDALRQGLQPCTPPARPFTAHLEWLDRQDRALAERHWRSLFAGFASPTLLPTSRQAGSFAMPAVRLDSTQLQAVAAIHGVTLNTLVQAAWAVALCRYSGETDVVFGATRSGRRRDIDGIDTTVGLLINTVPVRTDVTGDRLVADFVRGLREQSAAAQPFDFLGPIDVQSCCDLPHGSPLYESIVVFENYRLEEALRDRGGDWASRTVTLHEQPHYPLALCAYAGRELELKLHSDSPGLDAAQLLRHVARILHGFAEANETSRLRDLPMLDEAERRLALVEWNDTAGDFPHDRRIEQLFEARVDQSPHSVAVLHDGASLTYAELESRANRLAHHLRTLGVGPGALVAVCMNRSAEMIVALVGILKSGAAYVPLDPAYPKERLAFLLSDTTAAMLITQVRRLAQLPDVSIPVVCIDADWPTILLHSASRPERTTGSRERAYVIHTSGSTGTPKGVVLSHRAVVNTLDWVNKTFGVGARDRVLFVTSICFDLSVYDIFGVLAAGGSIRVATGAELRDPERLLEVLCDEPITLWDSAPSLLAQLAPHFDTVRERGSLRLVLLSGDWIPVPLPDRVRSAFPGADVIALGGATEAAIWSNFYRVGTVDPKWPSIPYGRPIQNARYYLLDTHGQPAPVGAPAELYIGGECLAEGYWNRPELTAERFSSAIERVYRTGDLAKYWPDGTIEFLGRRDQQVKIRGFRIELGEIEATLAQHPAVLAAAANVVADPCGEKQIVAYVVPRTGEAIVELRRFLQAKLPEYLLPAHVVPLAALPLTANGKLDRRALPAPDLERIGREFTLPRNETEEAIAVAWRDVLGVERVGIHDNFFELGGHSLRAAQVVSRIRRRLGRELPLAAFFRRPTIADAARDLEPGREPRPIPPVDARAGVPASPTQRQLWFLHQLGQGSEVYTIAYSLSLTGSLDVAALRAALSALVVRHDALRVAFSGFNGQLTQTLAELSPVDLPMADFSDGFAADFARAGFDLRRGPLWRFQLLRVADDEHRLLLALHHTIADGQSILVLVRELAELYAHRPPHPNPPPQGGREPELPAAPSWLAYCGRLESTHERDLTFWKNELTPLPPTLTLPGSRTRIGMPAFRGNECPLELPSELSASMLTASRKEGVTPFVFCLAAFQTLLARTAGQNDFAVGVPVDCRSDGESLVGPLVNTVVMRARLDGEPTFRELLGRTRDAVLAALDHQEMPFDELVRELKPERDPAISPLFQVLFSYSPEVPAVDVPGGHWTATPLPTGTAKFDLSLWLYDAPAGPHGHFEYDTDLLDAATIEQLAGHFRTLLAGAVADPGVFIGKMPLLDSAQRRTILEDWNATRLDVPEGRCVHDLIAAQAARTPERIAARLDDMTLTYAELNTRSNRLARKLLALGVGPDVPVGLFMERSLDALVAALAVWKSGGAYLPLDPGFPPERLEHYLTDSKPPVVITAGNPILRENDRGLISLDELRGDFNIVDLVLDGRDIAGRSEIELPSNSEPHNLAYIIYTSGSTGAPKGVMVPHSALVNFLTSMTREPGFTADDRVLSLTTLSFDIHALEMWLPLTIGATVELVSPEVAVDGLRL